MVRSQRGSVLIEIAIVIAALAVTVGVFFGLLPVVIGRQAAVETIRSLNNLRDPLLITQLTREGGMELATPTQVLAAFREHAAVLGNTAPQGDFCLFMIEVRSTNAVDCSVATPIAFYPFVDGVAEFRPVSGSNFGIDISSTDHDLDLSFGVRGDGSVCLARPVAALEDLLVRSAQQNPCLKPTPYYLYAVFDANNPAEFDVRGSLSLRNLDDGGGGTSADAGGGTSSGAGGSSSHRKNLPPDELQNHPSDKLPDP